MLETIKFIDNEDENIRNQIDYVNIITSFCKDTREAKAKAHY